MKANPKTIEERVRELELRMDDADRLWSRYFGTNTYQGEFELSTQNMMDEKIALALRDHDSGLSEHEVRSIVEEVLEEHKDG